MIYRSFHKANKPEMKEKLQDASKGEKAGFQQTCETGLKVDTEDGYS